jgi:hypothetical protein
MADIKVMNITHTSDPQHLHGCSFILEFSKQQQQQQQQQ